MSQASPDSAPLASVPAAAWEDLLAAGRTRGELDADEVVRVLKDVELTHELIEMVQGAIARQHAVVFRGPDGTGARGMMSPAVVAHEVPQLLIAL